MRDQQTLNSPASANAHWQQRLVSRQWQGLTMINADCLDCLPIEADAVITDPPYGMDWNPTTTRFSGGNNPSQRSAGRNDYAPVLHDDRAFDPSPWLDYPAVVMFGCNHYAQRLPVGTTLIWLKWPKRF